MTWQKLIAISCCNPSVGLCNGGGRPEGREISDLHRHRHGKDARAHVASRQGMHAFPRRTAVIGSDRVYDLIIRLICIAWLWPGARRAAQLFCSSRNRLMERNVVGTKMAVVLNYC